MSIRSYIGVLNPLEDLVRPERAFSEGWEFIPRDGKRYTEEDWKACFTQQPLIVNGQFKELKPYLCPAMGGCPDLPVRPPILHFGWRLEPAQVMPIIRAQFPDQIREAWRSQEELDRFIDEDDGPEFTSEGMLANPDALHDHLRLGLKQRQQLNFSVFCDSRGVPGIGLSIGTSCQGILGPRTREKVCELFNLEISDAQWYLDRKFWYWFNRRPGARSSSPEETSAMQHAVSPESSTSSQSNAPLTSSGMPIESQITALTISDNIAVSGI
ncbi:unnamed protein product [Peniophora sp. CBMAI 1063]|nr:unnamed protein product [Peniophora sp. CBMAI 1063]